MSNMSNMRRRWIRALAGAAALALVLGADEPTKTVDAGGLSFRRTGVLEIGSDELTDAPGPAQGRARSGRRVPGLAGGLCVPRRSGLGRGESSSAGRASSRTPTATPPRSRARLSRARISRSPASRRRAITNPGPSLAWPPSPSARTPACWSPSSSTARVGYFLKMVGPDKTMTSLKPSFDALISSLEVKRITRESTGGEPRARRTARREPAFFPVQHELRHAFDHDRLRPLHAGQPRVGSLLLGLWLTAWRGAGRCRCRRRGPGNV